MFYHKRQFIVRCTITKRVIESQLIAAVLQESRNIGKKGRGLLKVNAGTPNPLVYLLLVRC